ncbi:MAG TPA: metallophosphoesterase [Candidatus Excrementavichristensenella intestinipullorum]|nr:metallophosphoesterase [Candidatus Excrementavichristensenella intestinipullorum]
MIRLALVSDSHGRGDTLKAAAGGMEGCEGLCHLGDLVPDGQRMSQMLGLPLYGVRGNCDGWENAPEEMVLNVAGHKLLLCHGHRYGVKESLTRLYLRGQEAGADIVLYGHTHQPRVDRNGPMMLINPGALMNGRWAVLEFREMGPVPVMKIL